MADNLPRTELPRIMEYWMGKNTHIGLRGKLSSLLCWYGCLRWDQARKAELADLFTIPVETDPSNPEFLNVPALILQFYQSKTNQTGKKEYAGILRSFDPDQCAIGTLALYLFTRYHIEDEPWPDFAENANWYSIKVYDTFVWSVGMNLTHILCECRLLED